jgi:hypothetical protein
MFHEYLIPQIIDVASEKNYNKLFDSDEYYLQMSKHKEPAVMPRYYYDPMS